jgi:hypothetical protein
MEQPVVTCCSRIFFHLGCVLLFLLFLSDSVSFVVALLVNLAVWWLLLEAVWNSVVVVQLEDQVLTVTKPLQHRSVFSRKKHKGITIRPDEWDTLFHRTYKNTTSFYFRKEREAQYFFATEGFGWLPGELQQYFPDKEVKMPKYGMPVDVLRDLRRYYPKRVL